MEPDNLIFMQELIKTIKANKKYKSISDEIVLDEIKKYLKSKPSNSVKQIVKDIRKELHLSYASFQTRKKSKRDDYLIELQKNPDALIDLTKKLLSITLSTKERLEDYRGLYQKIFTITRNPKTIIDLGCGLNPVSFPFMNLNSLVYYAFDIDNEDIRFLNNYFEIMKQRGLEGKAEILNLNNKEKVSELPLADIIFLFKVIDIIDKKDHRPSEELINSLIKKAKFIVASFATKTITRKKMNFPNRKWFELMLGRNNLRFKIIETDNEIFYAVFK
jgi:16S rRNA (guanine(1405)-N(7))-methyltransferase